MKKRISGFIAGVLVTIIVSTLVVPTLAAHIEATFNSVNITLNGKQVARVGESYTLNDGTTTPYSIVYNNTTYLPMRKLAEMLELNVEWEGESRTATLNNAADPDDAANNVDEFDKSKYDEFMLRWEISEPVERYTEDGDLYYAYNLTPSTSFPAEETLTLWRNLSKSDREGMLTIIMKDKISNTLIHLVLLDENNSIIGMSAISPSGEVRFAI